MQKLTPAYIIHRQREIEVLFSSLKNSQSPLPQQMCTIKVAYSYWSTVESKLQTEVKRNLLMTTVSLPHNILLRPARFITQLSALDISAPHISAPHISALHISALHISALHISARHISAPHISGPHISALHISTPHISAPHISTLHISALHISALHISALHISALHISALHISALHISVLHMSAPHISNLVLSYSLPLLWKICKRISRLSPQGADSPPE